MRPIALGLVLVSCLGACGAVAAGRSQPVPSPDKTAFDDIQPLRKGRVVILDGTTLWFPDRGERFHLDGLWTCAWPQWALDWSTEEKSLTPAPVPCGALAKSWLKRAVRQAIVVCQPIFRVGPADLSGRCSVDHRDLGLEMLRVGWARLATQSDPDPGYVQAELDARSARYGLWRIQVLDMVDQRTKSRDRGADLPISRRKCMLERRGQAVAAHDACGARTR